MNTVLKYVNGLDLPKIVMQNFAEIRTAVLEKMTFEVAIFGNFAGYSRTEIVTSVLGHESRPDATFAKTVHLAELPFLYFL